MWWLCLVVGYAKRVPVKVIQMAAKPSQQVSNNAFVQTTPNAIPSTVPLGLTGLNGICIRQEVNSLEDIQICPFQNVTQIQKSVVSSYGQTLFGIFDSFHFNNLTMTFTRGQSCSAGNFRESLVQFRCSIETGIEEFVQTDTCRYSMVIKTPQACFLREVDSAEQVWNDFIEMSQAQIISLTEQMNVISAKLNALQSCNEKPTASSSQAFECIRQVVPLYPEGYRHFTLGSTAEAAFPPTNAPENGQE
jgi:hypothetical protein